MEILQKLAFISVILNFDLLKLMQFNDLHLYISIRGLSHSLYRKISGIMSKWMAYYGILKL